MKKRTAKIFHADCQDWMREQRSGSVRCVVTSPPYNLRVKYHKYSDKLPRGGYLRWLSSVFESIEQVLHPLGHFFLNVGYINADPWVDMEVAEVAGDHFELQNRITWVKSISIGDVTHGHFKPINSPRFATPTNEMILHLTKSGNEPVDRNSIGVPYTDKSNLNKLSRARGRIVTGMGFKNWRDFGARATARDRKLLDEKLTNAEARIGEVNDRRCRGNTWFIPYDTIKDRTADRGKHPATFPVQLAEMCIKFSGCPRGSLIYDPFIGSGTTMVAALALGMRGVGTDIDSEYVKYARKRLKS